jgi:hypothetical protein
MALTEIGAQGTEHEQECTGVEAFARSVPVTKIGYQASM